MLNLIVATIPVVLLGLVFEQVVGAALRSITVIAWAGIIFGIILYAADKYGHLIETVKDTTLKRAIIFGLAQCMALVNGVSRSGACLTAGRFMNYKRTDAARFVFLMSIPTLTAAGTLKGYQLLRFGNLTMLNDAALMFVFSFIFGLGAISFMMRWLQKSTFTPFVVYRIFLSIVLLFCIYSGYLSPIPCH